MDVPLYTFKTWSPFHLDALGLVTLLGAEEVSTAIGALSHSRYTEYLPLFGTNLIAENRFTHPIPGFALYNISDGIYIPIVNGWFSRWMIANLTEKITVLKWDVEPTKRSAVAKEIFAAVIGFIANGSLITIAALQGDFYGLANTIAMAVSVMVRLTMVHENRKHLNQIVDGYSRGITGNSFLEPNQDKNWVKIVVTAPEDKVVAFLIQRGLVNCIINDLDVVVKEKGLAEERVLHISAERPQNCTSSGVDAERAPKSYSSPRLLAPSDLAIRAPLEASVGCTSPPLERISVPLEKASDPLAPISKTESPAEPTAQVQTRTGRNILINLNNKKSYHTWIYTSARGVGWMTFAIHVICIGQSSLLTQVLSVALLVCSTVLTIYNVGNDNPEVGDRLSVNKIATLNTHKDAYLYLHPTDEEERVLRRYLRLPYRPECASAMGEYNDDWWKKWDAKANKKRN
jgi:hypothetical protein